MSLKSIAQALLRPLFDNGSDQQGYSGDFDKLDQSADSSAYNIADFFSVNPIANMFAFAPDANASTPSHSGSSDPGAIGSA